MSQWQVAWIIDWWVTTPIYHFSDYDGVSERRWEQAKAEAGVPPGERPPQQGPWKDTYSYCGRKLVDRGIYRDADPIPTKHAIEFARPCKGCQRAIEAERRETEHAD